MRAGRGGHRHRGAWLVRFFARGHPAAASPVRAIRRIGISQGSRSAYALARIAVTSREGALTVDREADGRFFREAWIQGVKRYFPGTPKESYIAPWEAMREWEQQ